jgi:o-succinylbenzoate synthase
VSVAAAPGEALVRRAWWQAFRVPFRAAFVAAHGTMTYREGIVVGVETTDGRLALGEASPLTSYSGGDIGEASEALRQLATGVVGKPVDTVWRCDLDLRGIGAGAEAAARCGIETATADLLSRARGVPLSAWLAERCGTSASAWVEVNGTIDATGPEEAAAEARSFVGRGFRTLKVKVGTGREGDIARMRAVREAAGDDVEIRVDANGGWSESEAEYMLGRCAEFGVALCEQPVSPAGDEAMATMARLRAGSPVRIAVDEGCRTLGDVEAIVATGAADAVVIKPMASGLKVAVAMVARANEAGLPVIVTTMFDAGVGTALAMHLAAALGGGAPACGLATLGHLEHPLAKGVPPVKQGAVRLSKRAGPGVTLDARAFERYAVGPRVEVRA